MLFVYRSSAAPCNELWNYKQLTVEIFLISKKLLSSAKWYFFGTDCKYWLGISIGVDTPEGTRRFRIYTSTVCRFCRWEFCYSLLAESLYKSCENGKSRRFVFPLTRVDLIKPRETRALEIISNVRIYVNSFAFRTHLIFLSVNILIL